MIRVPKNTQELLTLAIDTGIYAASGFLAAKFIQVPSSFLRSPVIAATTAAIIRLADYAIGAPFGEYLVREGYINRDVKIIPRAITDGFTALSVPILTGKTIQFVDGISLYTGAAVTIPIAWVGREIVAVFHPKIKQI